MEDYANQAERSFSKETLEQLLLQYRPLIIATAKKYQGRGVDLDDLIQEASIGLMRAAEKFDSTRSVYFGTYSTWWIRQSIVRAIYEQSHAIRVPYYRVSLMFRVVRESRQLHQILGHEPTVDEIAAHLPEGLVTKEMIADLLNEFQQRDIESIDAPLYDETEETLADTLSDDEQNPESMFFQQKEREGILQLLQVLNRDECTVISLRLGLLGEAQSCSEVARRMKKQERTIVGIEQRALLKLRRAAHYLQRDYA